MGQSGAGRGCAEATWWPFVEFLSGVTGGSSTWGTLPLNMFRFGAGGVAGWGTICGTLNAAAASSTWSSATPPTARRSPTASSSTTPRRRCPRTAPGSPIRTLSALAHRLDARPRQLPLENVPTSTANSPLCHSSLVQWTMTTNATERRPAAEGPLRQGVLRRRAQAGRDAERVLRGARRDTDLHPVAGWHSIRPSPRAACATPRTRARRWPAAPATTTRSPTTISD